VYPLNRRIAWLHKPRVGDIEIDGDRPPPSITRCVAPSRQSDLAVHRRKRKQLGSYRSSTKDIDAGLKVPRPITLESALEWIADD
jgi:hypothetical protein